MAGGAWNPDVNITTNGTVTKRLHEIIEKAKPYLKHLHFAFSFHYIELKRLRLIETFFNNIKMVRDWVIIIT